MRRYLRCLALWTTLAAGTALAADGVILGSRILIKDPTGAEAMRQVKGSGRGCGATLPAVLAQPGAGATLTVVLVGPKDWIAVGAEMPSTLLMPLTAALELSPPCTALIARWSREADRSLIVRLI